MRHAIADIHHDTGENSLSVERQNRLVSERTFVELKAFEHHFEHFLSIADRIERRFGEQNLALRWTDVHFLRTEQVRVNMFHIFPIIHDAILDRIVDFQRLSNFLC